MKFHTDSALQERQDQYLQSLHPSINYPIIIQYTDENCGHICHEQLEQQLSRPHGERYSIIDSSHALIYTTTGIAQRFQEEYSELIADFVLLLPELKIDTDLHVEDICNTSTSIGITLLILPIDSETLHDLRQFILKNTKSIEFHERDLESLIPFQENILTISLSCTVAKDLIQELSERSEVQWIERYFPMKPAMRWASPVTQSGKTDKAPMHQANLTGAGQIIGIADTGLDGDSCFFYDPDVPVPFDTIDHTHRKIVMYDTFADDEDASEHGTLVCGCAAGYCQDPKNNAYQYNGLAYEAKIAFVDIGRASLQSLLLPSNHYTGIYLPLYNAGARVMSMSWGDTSNSYTTSARSIDQFMWDYPESVILVAAGNDGDFGSNTVGSPATCKNGISVGASLNDETSWNLNGRVSTNAAKLSKNALAMFSSRGPTADGRLKPDICGVGNQVTAADANAPNECSVRVDSGTSFSSPVLAGGSALIRQYFMNGWYPSGSKIPADSFVPSGALIKAILVGSGQELSHITDTVESKKTSWGDNNQGYGRAQLSEALSFGVPSTLKGLTFFVRGSVDTSSPYYVSMNSRFESHTYSFRTAAKLTRPIRVTLAYTDYFGKTPRLPSDSCTHLLLGTVGSSKNLVNDLDLSVTDGNTIWSPLVTNAAEFGRRYDIRNNLEFIHLDSLSPNTNYTVTVRARSLSRPQPYALVISGEIGYYTYEDSSSGVSSGLSRTARILVILACCLTCCLTCLVWYIGFGSPTRKRRIDNAKEFLRILENVLYDREADDDGQDDEEEGEGS